MALVLNHNLTASNAARNLGIHYAGLATSVRRLSSGLRVGQASDDAAGLAIRELMRADIRALNQGVRNANDAISMIQTMDGALQIIDEKLIRMKELAEQAATGTYTSDQRLMLDSEFQAMAAEIDRIARATDFNGIKLLNGLLSGMHNGSGLESTGAVKVHFGTGNDSAEDYYYISGYDATINALFELGGAGNLAGGQGNQGGDQSGKKYGVDVTDIMNGTMNVNDFPYTTQADWSPQINVQGGIVTNGRVVIPPPDIRTAFGTKDNWFLVQPDYYFKIPAGATNIVINTLSYCVADHREPNTGDNDIQLYSLATGTHLAGTKQGNYSYTPSGNKDYINGWETLTGFTYQDAINTGPPVYDGTTVSHLAYNGMNIYYTGDGDVTDRIPNNGVNEDTDEYEILLIDLATEDLLFGISGSTSSTIVKISWDEPAFNIVTHEYPPAYLPAGGFHIQTQEAAQQMLERVDQAIINKDAMRAELGAAQNRLENTISNLQIQAENLQAAESRISDMDVALEMTEFVRQQILTNAAVTMLSQANSLQQMALSVLQG